MAVIAVCADAARWADGWQDRGIGSLVSGWRAERNREEPLVGNRFEVAVGAGTMRSSSGSAVSFPHRWTPGGVTVEADFTGGHLLHLAVAGCVLNDVYREAAALGIELNGVRVSAAGEFDTGAWTSAGISYSVEVSSAVSPGELGRLLAVVDQVAEIPRAIRAGASVRRVT
jgi:hypothetical protein